MIKAKKPENLKGIHVLMLKKIIIAMELLLRHYTNKDGLGEVYYEDPLCKIFSETTNTGENIERCDICPWTIMTGRNCVLDALPERVAYLRCKGNVKWNKKRIRELPRWIEWYNAEVKRNQNE